MLSAEIKEALSFSTAVQDGKIILNTVKKGLRTCVLRGSCHPQPTEALRGDFRIHTIVQQYLIPTKETNVLRGFCKVLVSDCLPAGRN